MSQIYKNTNSTPGGSVNTLSAEGGALTPPSGTNFNFTGSLAGGATANGGILFNTPANGQMDAVVQVDGSTVIINASNQLEAINSGVLWSVETMDLTAVKGHGYFTADPGAGPGSLQITLPVLAAVGDTFVVKDINGNGFTLRQNLGQKIQMLAKTTTVGVGGSIIAIGSGACLEIVCSIANTQFEAINFDGNLNVI